MSKPGVNEYLQPFVSEMKFLMANKFVVNEHQMQIKFGLVISDSPARAMIKGDIYIYLSILKNILFINVIRIYTIDLAYRYSEF